LSYFSSKIRPANRVPIWPYTLNTQSEQAKDLIVWVPMAQPGGNSTRDLGPSGATGTINGATWRADGYGKPALNFTASTSDFIDIPFSDTPFLSGCTLVWWGYITTAANFNTLASKCAGGGGSASPFDWYVGAGNQISVVRANSAHASWASASLGLPAGQFVMTAVTLPTAIESAPTFYVNNLAEVGTATGGGGTGAATGSGHAIYIGKRDDGATLLRGYTSEFRAYSTIKSASQIWAMYDAATRYELYRQHPQFVGKAASAPSTNTSNFNITIGAV
jgi:hypothetical protein